MKSQGGASPFLGPVLMSLTNYSVIQVYSAESDSEDSLAIRVSGYRLGHINPTATAVYGVVGSELISGLKLGDFSVVAR